MPRPRNIIPPVRERRRRTITELRVWFYGRWHHVGFKGDPPAVVRDKVLAVVSTAPKPKTFQLPQPQGLTVARLFVSFLQSDKAPRDPKDRAAVRRAGLLLTEFLAGKDLAAWLTAAKAEEWRDWLCTVKARVYRGKNKEVKILENKVLSKEYITRLLAKLRGVYRWGGKKGLVPASIAGELRNVEPLTQGKARLSKPPKPVAPAEVAAVMPHLRPVVRSILKIQRATGARPSEILRMRPREIHRSGVVVVGHSLVDLDAPEQGKCWLYLPSEHKTDDHGEIRTIPIPPSVQDELSLYLRRDPDCYCFAPWEQEVMTGRCPRSSGRAHRNRFDTASYTRSIQAACKLAKVPAWTAYQIRHLGIFEVAAEHGARAAQLFAGHKDLSTTSRYLSFDAKTLFNAVAGR